MPKLKTRKGVKKRFKITGTGKVLRSKANRRHLLTDRSRSKKRHSKGFQLIDPTDAARVIKNLPYGGR